MRWIFRGVLGLILLCIVAVITLLFLPAEKIASLVESRFQQATGRAMTVTGDVRPTIWPSLGVTTGAVTIANAPWSDAGPMLRAESLSVSVDLAKLIRGNIHVTGVSATAPDILLEIGPGGQGNWEFETSGGGDDSSGAAGGLPELTIDRAEVKRGALRFRDRRSGSDLSLKAVDATLTLPSMRGKATLELSALMNDKPLRLKSTIDGLAAFVERGAVPVSAEATLGAAKAGFSGRAGLTPLAAAGRLTADLGDLSDIMGLMGQSAPGLPQGLGRDKVALVGDVTFTDNLLNLRSATVTLDNNSLAGDADLNLQGDRPALNAKLATGALDLSGLSGSETGGGTTSTGWSSAPIDVSGLQAMDAKISLVATSVRIGATTLGATNLYTVLDRGRAVTEIRQLQAYGGNIDGSVVVNSRGGLSTRVDVNGSALAISRLFNELLGYDRLVAEGNLSLNVLGVGNDMNTLMHSLKGEGRFSTGAGELLGFDLVGMLRTLDPNFRGAGSKTIFDRISASFTITDGVLRNTDLSLLAPLISASGGGQVGLGEQTLNFRVVPRLLAGEGIEVPILVTGPWSAPKFKLDLEGVAREKLKEEGKQLEEKAKEAARRKLEEELGTPITDGRSAEDAIKKRLEEEAKKGLLDLLGGN
ncbi:AsmA family protein [Oceaniglobus trochenteri]|uniref:AsmA family protein n=1 Tax=Oceaniglobus trochenteri TaxID=2763260 RepID=UPI001CFFEC1A|nr:AsmA family protein [Oceaniglobus trochenteri]